MDVEVLTFALSLGVEVAHESAREAETGDSGTATSTRSLFDVERAQFIDAQVFKRSDIGADAISGPAVVVEDQTSTVVPRGFSAVCGEDGALILRRIDEA